LIAASTKCVCTKQSAGISSFFLVSLLVNMSVKYNHLQELIAEIDGLLASSKSSLYIVQFDVPK